MPERVKNIFQELSVGSVQQNIAVYLTLSVRLTMVIGQHYELKARDKKPLFGSLRPLRSWRGPIWQIKKAWYLSRKRTLALRKKIKAGNAQPDL